jgi:hypothetical protein
MQIVEESLFWHITQCKQSFASTLLHADFLLGLSFNPEHESDMLLCNVGWLSADYTALFPRTYGSSQPQIKTHANIITKCTSLSLIGMWYLM